VWLTSLKARLTDVLVRSFVMYYSDALRRTRPNASLSRSLSGCRVTKLKITRPVFVSVSPQCLLSLSSNVQNIMDIILKTHSSSNGQK